MTTDNKSDEGQKAAVKPDEVPAWAKALTEGFTSLSADNKALRAELTKLAKQRKDDGFVDDAGQNEVLEGLQKTITALSERQGRLEAAPLLARRDAVAKAYGIPADSIKDLAEPALAAMESKVNQGAGQRTSGVDGVGGRGTQSGGAESDEKAFLTAYADGEEPPTKENQARALALAAKMGLR